VQRPELYFALVYAATEVKHDESVGKCAELESDLHGIVQPQFAGAHSVFENGDGRAECGGAPGFEVCGIDPRAFPRGKKHQLIEVWERKGGIQKDVGNLSQPVVHIALELQCLDAGRKFIEALIGNRIKEAGPIPIVAIDGHGGNADPFRDGAHGDCGEAVPVKKLSSGRED
jgi:hypothetical protein